MCKQWNISCKHQLMHVFHIVINSVWSGNNFCWLQICGYHINSKQKIVLQIIWSCIKNIGVTCEKAISPLWIHLRCILTPAESAVMGCMCSIGPFQFRWLRGYIHSSCYYHHQIRSINLTHYHIFPWLCAWDVSYIIFCHLLHIHSGKTGILFSSLLCRLWWVQIFG